MGSAREGSDSTGVHSAGWTDTEVSLLHDAVSWAPSVHNSHPWSLRLHNRTAVLRERAAVSLERHDPGGRDRRVSCGAAVENLLLAVLSAGWAADVDLGTTGGLVTAAITARIRAEPGEQELRWAGAMSRRRSHRERFGPEPLSDPLRESLLDAGSSSRAGGRWIEGPDEALWVARLLVYAATVFRDNVHYARELAQWSAPSGEDLREESSQLRGLAAVGLAASGTHVPDEGVLAARIRDESVLVLGTRDDRPSDHARVGRALERVWLEATSAGLAVSVLTQPLHLGEVRSGLADRLSTPLVPQVLVRFGHPA